MRKRFFTKLSTVNTGEKKGGLKILFLKLKIDPFPNDS